MSDMRKLINLMEGVMAVPGVGPSAGGNTESDMQTTGTIGRNQAYGEYDSATPNLTENASPDVDQILYYLTSAWRVMQDMASNDHISREGLRTIGFIYESLRDALKKEDFQGFEKAWEYAGANHVDAFDFFIDEVFAQAGLGDKGTYDEFMQKCSSMEEKAPPGKEKLVRSLKKEYPGHEEKAFATAWSIYNKEHGKTNESASAPAVHNFPNSRDAYDATQTGEWYDDATDSLVEVKNGDILVIPSEGVVGICSTWPVAVTQNAGKLHAMKPEYATVEDIAEVIKLPASTVKKAFDKASELGFKVVGNLGESIPAVNSCNQSNPEDCRTACAMESIMEQSLEVQQALKSFESAVMTYGMAPEEAYDRISQQLGDEDLEAFRAALEAQGFADMADAENFDLEPVGSFDMSDDAAALASAGHGSDEDYGYHGDGSDFEFDEAYDLNNGYHDVELANSGDYFPNGADGPVVKATGPSGARQGDNPEQKKMQVAETHKELVYAYRKYLKESAK